MHSCSALSESLCKLTSSAVGSSFPNRHLNFKPSDNANSTVSIALIFPFSRGPYSAELQVCLHITLAGGSWSDALDMEAGTVWVNSNQSVTVPCGDVESSQDISRMYYMRDTGYILANSTNEELTTNISLSDINKQICCLVDDAIFPEPQEYCYNIMESCKLHVIYAA